MQSTHQRFSATSFAATLASALVLSASLGAAAQAQEHTPGVYGEVLPAPIVKTETRATARAANLPVILQARRAGEILQGEGEPRQVQARSLRSRDEVRAETLQARHNGELDSVQGEASPFNPYSSHEHAH